MQLISILITLGYIDPGTGSIIIQAIVGGIAGIAIAVKLYWTRVRAFFGYKSKANEEDDND